MGWAALARTVLSCACGGGGCATSTATEGAGRVRVMLCADASTLMQVAVQPNAHGQGDDVESVGFSPDGTRIVSCSGDTSLPDSGDYGVKVWGGRRSLALCSFVFAVAASVRWKVAEGVRVCACYAAQIRRRWHWSQSKRAPTEAP
eukprot:405246-Prymnesium_polylepis.1